MKCIDYLGLKILCIVIVLEIGIYLVFTKGIPRFKLFATWTDTRSGNVSGCHNATGSCNESGSRNVTETLNATLPICPLISPYLGKFYERMSMIKIFEFT